MKKIEFRKARVIAQIQKQICLYKDTNQPAKILPCLFRLSLAVVVVVVGVAVAVIVEAGVVVVVVVVVRQ